MENQRGPEESEKECVKYCADASTEFSEKGYEQFQSLVENHGSSAQKAYFYLLRLSNDDNQWILTNSKRVDDIQVGVARDISKEFLEEQRLADLEEMEAADNEGAAPDWMPGERRGLEPSPRPSSPSSDIDEIEMER